MRVAISTDLDLPAEEACRLAARSEVLLHVMAPVLGLATGDAPATLGVGGSVTARLRVVGVPLWRHTIRVVEAGPRLLRTEERGGPVRVWNHRLDFTPLGPDRCRYTDVVELRAGPLTLPVALFAHAFYRWRQRRWRSLPAALRVLGTPAPAGAAKMAANG